MTEIAFVGYPVTDLKRPRLLLAVGIVLGLTAAGQVAVIGAETAALPVVVDCDPRLKAFAAQKRQQVEELAARLHLEVPPEAREFFQAAEVGDWNTVSNRFEKIWRSTGQTEANPLLPSLRNVLYIPIRETFKAYEQFQSWDAPMRQKFADGILGSIPDGSIYFAGTNPGRYITAVIRDAARSPDIHIISQTDFPASYHLDYVRLVYGGRIRIPSEKDASRALCQSGEEVKGTGVMAAMLNSLTKTIFEDNKAEHEFYVEESFVIPWMYPYLEPHGMILKLNKEPLARLDSAVVARDRQFWDALTKELLADPKFLGNEWERNHYAKLRSAIGGLYQYRHLTNDAEVVFQQASELGPTNPEAAFRLTRMYAEMGRFDEALAELDRYRTRLPATSPYREYATKAIAQIRDMKRQAVEGQSGASPTPQ